MGSVHMTSSLFDEGDWTEADKIQFMAVISANPCQGKCQAHSSYDNGWLQKRKDASDVDE